MIIDTNAYLGYFAFRQLRHNTPVSLLKLMDAKGIDKAMVSSASAITYRNTQPANEELAAAVQPHRDRLIPLAVINPSYAGWHDDLEICTEKFGMVGLRMYPKWHNYDLADGSCLDLVAQAAQRKMFVSLPLRVEDYRQRSWLVDVPDVSTGEVAALIESCLEAKFILLNGRSYTRTPLGRADSPLPANYHIEISRLSAVLDNEIGALVANLGADRIVFGTGMPFKSPDPSLVKIEALNVSKDIKDRILGANAAQLLD